MPLFVYGYLSNNLNTYYLALRMLQLFVIYICTYLSGR